MSPTKIFGLGGMQEIGKSTLVIQYENHIFIIDTGIKFCDSYVTGVNGSIPDFTFLAENQDNRRSFHNPRTWRSYWRCSVFSSTSWC